MDKIPLGVERYGLWARETENLKDVQKRGAKAF